ncbi:MAG TPA: protocatechuate 3,4-dioxygenase subunit beta [Actinomycetales bacterium]|jgi:protocatechuate 3,4-dioxygenase beta subunit
MDLQAQTADPLGGQRSALPRYRVDAPGTHPPSDYAAYRSTRYRHPLHARVGLPQRLTEVTGPVFGDHGPADRDADLTRQHDGEPVGQRITVSGRVLDGDGRPVAGTLVEVWQANAAGRYRHDADRWPAPLDPAFSGLGRLVTDSDGGYSFTTIRPGAYPWRNHTNAWRPAHIHFSLFGRAFTQRLVTQMYFPQDPLHDLDPMITAIPELEGRGRLVAAYDHGLTVPEWSLGYRWDIVLRGRDATPFESGDQVEDDE